MTNFSTSLLVAAVALLDRADLVLMQKRRAESVHGGLWEFPGGKVESGETPQETAIREISEELGLELDAGGLEPLSFASGAAAEPQTGGLVILLYTCRRWSGQPMCHGADAIAWYRPRELAGLQMPPLDYPLAERLTSMVGS